MRKALIIGIDDYPTAPLHACVNDATQFKAVIESNGDGSANFDAKLYTNVKDKAHLRRLAREIFSGGPEVQVALFYFSGHGYANELGGYMVTPDATSYDEGVSMDEILALANQSKVLNRIIIFDCCHAGYMGSPRNDFNQTAIHSGVTILSSSKADQVSMEKNGHGVFTELLLGALQGGAANLQGHITAGSIYAYIDQALGSWDQRPVFKTNIVKFASLRNIPPPVAEALLRKLTTYFPSKTYEFPLDPEYEFTYPTAKPEKIEIFKTLQKFESVHLVTPVGEEHMYWAAMNSKSCKLTALGLHYWRLINDKRL